MKHIKTFKVFESVEDIIDYCKDILLPLNDDGLSTYIKTFRKIKNGIIIRITKRVNDREISFNLKKYKDDLNMLKDYLESEGYILKGALDDMSKKITWNELTNITSPYFVFGFKKKKSSKIKRMFKWKK